MRIRLVENIGNTWIKSQRRHCDWARLLMSVSTASIGRTWRVGVACLVRPHHARLPRVADGVRPRGACVTVPVGNSTRRWSASAAAVKQGQATPVSSLKSPPDGIWRGLEDWRAGAVGAGANRAWVWGKRDAVPVDVDPKHLGPENEGNVPPGAWASPASTETIPLPDTLAACADLILRTPDPAMKAALSHRAYAKFAADARSERRGVAVPLAVGTAFPPASPARPAKPELVHPKDVPSPKTCALGFSAAMMHNIAHIELNAIDLAWDTVARFAPMRASRFPAGDGETTARPFAGLPDAFFLDFAKVADDESRHLGWCLQRLQEMGVAYGDIPAHNVLWEGAQSTADSLPARLAVVPCMQEARGLDAGPRLVSKLRGRGDNRSADIIARISAEELAHVAVGVAWFRHVCGVLSVDPRAAFSAEIETHAPESLRGPFNHAHRVDAGLEPDWYATRGDDGAFRMGREFPEHEGVAGDEGLSGELVRRLRDVLAMEGVSDLDD